MTNRVAKTRKEMNATLESLLKWMETELNVAKPGRSDQIGSL